MNRIHATRIIFANAALAGLLVSGSPIAHAADCPGPNCPALISDCKPPLPVNVGEPLTFTAEVTGGSGQYSYQWYRPPVKPEMEWVALPGETAPAYSRAYPVAGVQAAKVLVTDQVTGETSLGDGCWMHVRPNRTVEPYIGRSIEVHPVAWFAKDAPFPDANALNELRRAWRGIHAGFYHQYGRTFVMKPVDTIISPFSEQDICGGDCSDLYLTGALRNRAGTDLGNQFGPTYAYTTARSFMVWGAGAYAGSPGWNFPLATSGDIALSAVMGVPTPPLENNLHRRVAVELIGNYINGMATTIAHETNHAIGWDDPHNYSLFDEVNDYERQLSLAGPWLTETPTDVIPPTVEWVTPHDGQGMGGTITAQVNATDDVNMDAVVFLADGQFLSSDATSPYQATLNTHILGSGKHVLEALAYDAQGNVARSAVHFFVENLHSELWCQGHYPTGYFKACFYDGLEVDSGSWIGTLEDAYFPWRAVNAGYLVRHFQSVGEPIAFERTNNITGVWRGKFPFPAGDYLFRLRSSYGLRLYINNVLVDDSWNGVPGEKKIFTNVPASSNIRVEWRHQNGNATAVVFAQPFTFDYPAYLPVGLSLVSPAINPATDVVTMRPGEPTVLVFEALIDDDATPFEFETADVRQGDIRGLGATISQVETLIDGRKRWTITWTPKLADQGRNFNVHFRLTDYFEYVAEVGPVAMKVEVTQPGPVFEKPISNELIAMEGSTFRSAVAGVEPFGGPVTVTATGLPPNASLVLRGDANGNGRVDAADLVAVLIHYGKKVDSVALVGADPSWDGVIDDHDRTIISQLIYALPSYYLAYAPDHFAAALTPPMVTLRARDSTGRTTDRVVTLRARNTLDVSEASTQILGDGESVHARFTAVDDLGPVDALILPTSPAIQGPSPWIKLAGDVDRSGVLDQADVNLVSAIAGGQMTPTDEERVLADVNGDGSTTAADTAMVSLFASHIQIPRDFLFYWRPGALDTGLRTFATIFKNQTAPSVGRGVPLVVQSKSGVKGRILTAEGVPVPSATVELKLRLASGKKQKFSVLTDAEGRFVFRDIPSGTAEVRPELKTWRFSPRERRSIMIPSANNLMFTGKSTKSAPLAGQNAIVGTVTVLSETSGQLQSGVPLRLTGRASNGLRINLRTITGNNGQYAFANLPDGSYKLRSYSTSIRFRERIAALELAGGRVETRRFVGEY